MPYEHVAAVVLTESRKPRQTAFAEVPHRVQLRRGLDCVERYHSVFPEFLHHPVLFESHVTSVLTTGNYASVSLQPYVTSGLIPDPAWPVARVNGEPGQTGDTLGGGSPHGGLAAPCPHQSDVASPAEPVGTLEFLTQSLD